MLEIVYTGRDNSTSLLLKASTVNDPEMKIRDLTDVTRMILTREDGFVIDSDQEASVFDWNTLATSGIVTMQLGHLVLKNTKDKWRLIVFDATNPKGIVWGDKGFTISVEEKYASNT